MPMIERIDKSLVSEKEYTFFCAMVFTMEQICNRYDSIEKETCSHFLSPSYVLSLGWDIIDWSEKLRKLLGAARGIKKKDLWFKSIEEKLNKLKEVRDFIQHFDSNLNKSNDVGITPMGELTVRLNGKYYPNIRYAIFKAERGVGFDLFELQKSNREFQYEKLEMSGDIISSAKISLAGKVIDLKLLKSQICQAKHGFDSYLYDNYYQKS